MNRNDKQFQSNDSDLDDLIASQLNLIDEKNSKYRHIWITGALGIFLIVLGSVVLYFTLEIDQYSISYDSIKTCDQDNLENCEFEIEINRDFNEKVYVYYELTNFFQQSPAFYHSVSYRQIKGKAITESQAVEFCGDFQTNGDMDKTRSVQDYSTDTGSLISTEIAYPCGFYALTFFNDSSISINQKDLVWDVDREYNFKNYNLSKQWVDMEDEHFMNWMRPSGSKNTRKLYGRIEPGKLKRGKYKILLQNSIIIPKKISNNYLHQTINKGYLLTKEYFLGEQLFILTNLNVFGHKNYGLSISMIVVGVISLYFSFYYIKRYKGSGNRSY